MRVYPSTMKKEKDNSDTLYDLCVVVICWSCICILILIAIIIVIVKNIENEDGSGS